MDLFKKKPKPRDSSAITPTSKSNEAGSATSQILGKTGGDTYGGLVGPVGPDKPDREADQDEEKDETR